MPRVKTQSSSFQAGCAYHHGHHEPTQTRKAVVYCAVHELELPICYRAFKVSKLELHFHKYITLPSWRNQSELSAESLSGSIRSTSNYCQLAYQRRGRLLFFESTLGLPSSGSGKKTALSARSSESRLSRLAHMSRGSLGSLI